MNNITLIKLIELNRRAAGYAPDPSIEMPEAEDKPKEVGLSRSPLGLTKEQIEFIKRKNITGRSAIIRVVEEVTPVGN